ncbi:MAG: zf-HC2 domain-containing protein [Myxococcales bacterium]|nr:zf-HC2 domain-containing protein [Myxococcales bacterium]
MSDHGDCDRYRPEIIEWLDGTLDADEARDLADHVEQCTACGMAYQEMRALFGALREAPERDEEVETGARVLSELERVVSRRQQAPRRAIIALAAVLILAIAAALTLPRLRFESSTTAPMIAAPCPAVLAPLDLAFTPLPRIAPERLPKEERHQPARDDLDQIGQAVIDQLEELMENPQVAAEYDTEDSAYDADPLPVDLSNEELERLEQALNNLLLLFPKKG